MASKRHIPERTCCGCFSKRPVGFLLAITRLKDGHVEPNPEFKLPGRSAYLCRNKFCLAKARDRKGKDGLTFTLKTKVPAELWKAVEKIIGNK